MSRQEGRGAAPTPPPTEANLTALGVDPSDGAGCATTFSAGYAHSQGAETFRIVQLWIGAEVAAGVTAVQAALEYGIFQFGGQTCLPGEDEFLEGEHGVLDCAASWFSDDGNARWVHYAIEFDTQTFAGTHGIFFDAKGGAGDPEPRLGWTQTGSFTVVDDPSALGCAPAPTVEDTTTEPAATDAGSTPVDSEVPPSDADPDPPRQGTDPGPLGIGFTDVSKRGSFQGASPGNAVPAEPSGGCQQVDTPFSRGAPWAVLAGWSCLLVCRIGCRNP